MRRQAFALPAAVLLTALIVGCGDSDNVAGDSMSAQPDESMSEQSAGEPSAGGDSGVLRFTMNRLDGTPDDLSDYAGKVVLVVNTATECGFTPQFEGLDRLYEDKRGDGFVVLGFPADDVAGQEPRSDEEIAEFCEANYGVSFPMFAKITAEGDDAHPLFQELGEPDWNFNKYLLDREGRLVQRWGATTTPDDRELLAAIEEQTRTN